MASRGRARISPANRHAGKPARKTGSAPVKQSSQGICSVKEMNNELEKSKQNDVLLKTRIRSLEAEVETLHARLDSLRKAKNTTTIRREREPPLVPLSPGLGRGAHHQLLPPSPPLPPSSPLTLFPSSLSLSHEVVVEQYEERIRALESRLETKNREVEDVLRGKQSKLLESKASTVSDDNETVRDLRAEVSKLIVRNDELTATLFSCQETNKILDKENKEVEDANTRLVTEMTSKEEQWRGKVQQLEAEIRKQWGERYNEWIVKAEKKMEELQQVNALLQTMLKTKAHKPDM